MFSALRVCSRTGLPAWHRASLSRTLPLTNTKIQIPAIRALRSFHSSPPSNRTLNQSIRAGKKYERPRKKKSPHLFTCPQRKGVVSQVIIAKPKKPNSAKRKAARVKLSNGKTVMAYIQGEGHNLQEHSVVMVRGGRAQDLPGVRYKIVRGALDLSAVVGRVSARSKYGAKKPKK